MNHTYDKLTLAEQQLEAACICYSKDSGPLHYYISAIVLAGAAGEIFHQYLRLNDKNSITKRVTNIFTEMAGKNIKMGKVRSAINQTLINNFKHRDCDSDLFIESNLKKDARFGILTAMTDYKEIFHGKQDMFIYAFAENLAKEFVDDIGKDFSTKRISYKSIAINQLKRAIRLFVAKKYIPAITLAGAADNILISLLETKGKKCFASIAKEQDKNELEVGEIRKEFNDVSNINSIKHLDSLESRYIEIDVEACAYTAIVKALVNYNTLSMRLFKKDKDAQMFLQKPRPESLSHT